MTKIVCVGDIHVTDRPPRNANEEYTEDIIQMLLWIADYAAEIEADAVVWLGDVFHHKSPSKNSHALVLKMIQVVHRHLQLNIPLIAVTGNHDVSNDVLDTVYEKQPIGVLYKAGLQDLRGWHQVLPLFGVPWRHDWTTSESSPWDAFEAWRNAQEWNTHPREKCLAVTHAPIFPPGEAEKQLYDLVPTAGEHGISKAMDNKGSIAFGHIHEYAGIFEVEGVTYSNMGAISRGSLTEYNVNRKIKIAVWEDGIFSEVEVPHKPASEVLKIEKVAEEKAEKLSLDNFLAQVGSSSIDITSTQAVVGHIRSLKNVPDKVKKTAVEILEDAE